MRGPDPPGARDAPGNGGARYSGQRSGPGGSCAFPPGPSRAPGPARAKSVRVPCAARPCDVLFSSRGPGAESYPRIGPGSTGPRPPRRTPATFAAAPGSYLIAYEAQAESADFPGARDCGPPQADGTPGRTRASCPRAAPRVDKTGREWRFAILIRFACPNRKSALTPNSPRGERTGSGLCVARKL